MRRSVLALVIGACGGAPTALSDESYTADREACAFTAGAKARSTLGDVTAIRDAIRYVIVITQENYSFDTMFGMAGPGLDVIPAGYSNSVGEEVFTPKHLTTGCPGDPRHDRDSVLADWNEGAMDGFAATNGPLAQTALGYFTDADHPFYSWLLTTFATSDRYFSAVLDATMPNRYYLYAGQSRSSRHLFDQLDEAGIEWRDYAPGAGLEGAFQFAIGSPPSVRPWDEFFDAAASGALSPVTFVDMPNDEHPPGSVHRGENDVRRVILAAMASPLWPEMAIIMNYDENGGFFDHVPPPPACVAVPDDAEYDRLGMRVPLFVVSPYARPGYVSHEVHSHTSVLRFIQALFDLAALTARDANSDALLDLFDLDSPGFTVPPDPATIPAAFPPGC